MSSSPGQFAVAAASNAPRSSQRPAAIFDDENDHINDVANQPQLVGEIKRQQARMPAAEVENDGDAADGEHARVFRHEEDQPAKAAILRVKAGDQFAFRFSEIERGTFTARRPAGEKHPESQE